jgi:hypothetical protein
LLTVAVIALSAVAEANGLTDWDMRFLHDKLGIGPTSLSILGLTAQEKSCVHFLINRFGPEEKLVEEVTHFLDNVASDKIAGKKPPTKCPR